MQSDQVLLKKVLDSKDLRNDINDIPHFLHYIIVIPCSVQQFNSNNQIKKPIILTYKKQTTTFQELIEKFVVICNHFQKSEIQFQIFHQGSDKNLSIKNDSTIKEIKRLYGKKNLDGQIFFIIKKQQLTVTECALIDYLQQNRQQNSLQIICEIPQNKELIYVEIMNNKKISDLRGPIVKAITQIYNIKIEQNAIESLKNSSNVELKLSDSVCKLNDRDKVSIVFKNKDIVFKYEQNSNRSIIISNPGSQKLMKQSKKLSYDAIKFKKIEDIFIEDLNFPQDRASQCCLKIMDTVLKACDTLSVADKYFSKSKESLNLVAKIVIERAYFYNQYQSKLKKQEPFSFEELPFVPPYEKIKHRQQVENRAKISEISWFQQPKNIEPIFIYTSQKSVLVKQKTIQIYNLINKFLRESNFTEIEQKNYKEWEIRYIMSLITQLEYITPTQYIKKLYRGVSYDLDSQVGEVILLKQFTSTSEEMENAYRFAFKKDNPNLHILHSFSAKSIAEFSDFPEEKEYLIEPYTYFEVIKKYTEKREDKQIKIYELREVRDMPKQLPYNGANFIIWTSQNQKETLKLFEEIQANLTETTLLINMKSTQKLKGWVERNRYLLQDTSTRKIFITDMSRNQLGFQNENAGTQSVKYISNNYPQIPIMVYTPQDLKKVGKKLQYSRIHLARIKLSNSRQKLEEFILKNLKQPRENNCCSIQ